MSTKKTFSVLTDLGIGGCGAQKMSKQPLFILSATNLLLGIFSYTLENYKITFRGTMGRRDSNMHIWQQSASN